MKYNATPRALGLGFGLAAITFLGATLTHPISASPFPDDPPPVDPCENDALTPVQVWRCQLGLPYCPPDDPPRTDPEIDPFCFYPCEVDPICAALDEAIAGNSRSDDGGSLLFDVTGDCQVNALDRIVIIAWMNNHELIPCIWDVNNNRVADQTDVDYVNSMIDAQSELFDVNHDQVTDFKDRALIAHQMAQGYPDDK